MYQNKRYVTKETSRSTSKALDSLSNVPKVKYKENKSTKNRRSPEAIEVRLDMSHMRTGAENVISTRKYSNFMACLQLLDRCYSINFILRL